MIERKVLAIVMSLLAVTAGAAPCRAQEGASPPLPAPEPRRLEEVPDLFVKQEPQDPDTPAAEFSMEVLDSYVTFFPGRSTRLGIAEHDRVLGDYRRPSIAAFVGSNKGYLGRIDRIPTASLTDKGKLELEALRVYLRRLIFQLDTSAAPFRDPNFYVDESVGAVQALLDRDQSSPTKRAENLLARMSLFRYYFSVARENLGTCPKVAVRRAIMRLRASAPLLGRDVPDDMLRSGHPAAAKTAPPAGAAALKEAQAFADWLEKERLPKATEAVPLGEKGWGDWIASLESGPLTPQQVIAAAEADLKRLQEELRKTAAQISAGKAPAALVAELSADRLEPELTNLSARGTIDQLWEWVIRSKTLTPMTDEPILVRETPAFRRRDNPIRADLPGAYASKGAPAFLEIAPPDPTWPPVVLFPWLSAYGKPFLPGALMREVYPGRFTAWQRMRLSRIRACKAIEYPTMTEGWPLYAQEIGVRDGFGAQDPRIRSAMLVDMIRADARLIASVRLHTAKITPPEATTWLASEGYWPREEASIETERLLAEPDTVAGALGRLAILDLRDDVRRVKGAAFVEREFHELLVASGYAPISVLRKIHFPAAGPTLLDSK